MQIEIHTFKSLFYGKSNVDDVSLELFKELKNEYDLNTELIDQSALVKWVKTFYQKDILKNSIPFKINTLPKNFDELCEISSKEDLKKVFIETLSIIKFWKLTKYFSIIAEKRKYSAKHFRHHKYIENIHSEIMQIINFKHTYNFEFPNTANHFKTVNEKYVWLKFFYDIQVLENNYTYLYNTKFELRRNYDILQDHIILSDIGLQKIVFELKTRDNVLFLSDSIPADEWHLIKNFIIELYNTFHFLSLEFKTIHNNNFLYVIDLCKDLHITLPLKFFTSSDVDLNNELKKYFTNSTNISFNFYDKMIFKFNKNDLINFFDYSHHEYDKKTLIAILNNNTNRLMMFSVEFIWENFIDCEILADEFNFNLTNHNIEIFKSNYINGYMLREALNDSTLFETTKTLIDLIMKVFNVYREFSINGTGSDTYYIEIFPYAKKLINFINSDNYVLPTDGWELLGQYFAIFDKLYLNETYFDDYDTIKFKNIEVTLKLVEIIKNQYPIEIIKNEMQIYNS